MEGDFSMDLAGGWGWGGGWLGMDGAGGNASGGEGAADEAPLARPLLTSCSAARFLTGPGPVRVRSPAVGDPWPR